jgi:NAD(P) transhydrogenase subunit alpha
MKIGVPKETSTDERRVALVPDTVGRLIQSGLEVVVESGAGVGAFFSDQEYQDAGARIAHDAAALYQEAETVLKVQRPTDAEVQLLTKGSTLISFLQPATNLDLVKELAANNITSFSMDTIPRIARAQSMDALSSMSSISGYKAALIAANSQGRFFPMMMTAAGTVPPAKGLVLGAGVAGLQAIATARRLGAVVWAFDVRPAVKEQVESLGATFLEVEVLTEDSEDAGGYATQLSEEAQRREHEMIHQRVGEANFVITTALIPGRPAPILITEEMVRSMRPGSVIVDLAAEAGGNCELTQPGSDVVKDGVTVHGPLNLPSSVPIHASAMYSKNISALLLHLTKDGQFSLDFEDVITQGCCMTYQGNIVHEPTLALIQG